VGKRVLGSRRAVWTGIPGVEPSAAYRTDLGALVVADCLTVLTDADALMESINAAHIYHFLFKPWDPKELTHTVRRGVERYALAPRARAARARSRGAQSRPRGGARPPAGRPGRRRPRGAAASATQRYVSPRLVDLVVAYPTLMEPSGEWREATVPFADIAGYTRLTERTPARMVIRLLDEYLTRMVETIFRHGGTVEQLIGDEIVVLFGVPASSPQSAADALGGRGADGGAVTLTGEQSRRRVHSSSLGGHPMPMGPVSGQPLSLTTPHSLVAAVRRGARPSDRLLRAREARKVRVN
jgi:class 3 adenylate cyclase